MQHIWLSQAGIQLEIDWKQALQCVHLPRDRRLGYLFYVNNPVELEGWDRNVTLFPERFSAEEKGLQEQRQEFRDALKRVSGVMSAIS